MNHSDFKKYTWKVSFIGRESGAIGIDYRIDTEVKSNWPLSDESVLAHAYFDYDHISSFKILSRPEGIENIRSRASQTS